MNFQTNQSCTTVFGDVLRSAKIERLVIVGGSRNACHELKKQIGPDVHLKLVDGTRRVSRRYATRVVDSADLVVLWVSTPIHHSVADTFKAVTPKNRRMHIRRRGVGSLLREIEAFLTKKEAI